MSWNVAGVVRTWAQATPDRPAVTFEGTTQTWRELHDRSSRVANALVAAGVGAGDRVAIIDKNVPAHFDLLFGAAKLNAVYVAVNWRLAPPEIAEIVNDSGATVFFVGAEFLPVVDKVSDQLHAVTTIVVVGGVHAAHASLEDWIRGQPATDPGAVGAAGDVAVQLYTSGTTGLPKGVMLTNGNLGAALPGGADELGVSAGTVSMVAMPLFHIGGTGWALLGMHYGGHSVLVREVDPALILRSIEDLGVTHAFLVPAVLMFLLATPGVDETDFSSLECIAYGASPISEDVLVRCIEKMGCRFAQLYGLTETTGAITILRPGDHDPGGPNKGRLRSCGVPYRHVELRIIDPDDGSESATGAVGEVWTRSPQNMLGYWRKDEETAQTLRDEGWLRTGDAGYVDGDGFLYLHDRIKDMIVSGGENVYPAEVENVLMSHPDVADVAVIGVPDDRWGETVKAMVVTAPGAAPAPASLIAYAKERLAGFKCPTSVDFVDALPRNPSGKILKRELRAPFWAGRQRQIH